MPVVSHGHFLYEREIVEKVQMPEEAKHVFDGVTCDTCPLRMWIGDENEKNLECRGIPPQLLANMLAVTTRVNPPTLSGKPAEPVMEYKFGHISASPIPTEGAGPCGLHPIVQQRIKKIYNL